MNILLLLAHSIAEYDDLRMLTDLGYNVFSIGAYSDPANPGDDIRPPLPEAPYHPYFIDLCADQMAAKEALPDDVVDWADVVIIHHYLDQWLLPQVERLTQAGKRIIWRTCGQSDFRLEDVMTLVRAKFPVDIVRYSTREEAFFRPSGHWAGQDILIPFGKYLGDYGPWMGAAAWGTNFTQQLLRRGEAVGRSWYLEATQGVNMKPGGEGSEDLPGGLGRLDYDHMRTNLNVARAYVYTGTVPAPYTLGLIEAMASGVPVVSIGRNAWRGPADLFGGADLAWRAYDDPAEARAELKRLLAAPDLEAHEAMLQRAQMFDVVQVGRLWRAFLGAP